MLQLEQSIKQANDMTIQPWRELNREEVFRKYGRSIERVEFKLPHGDTADYYIKSEAPGAAILALTESNEVILARQFRPGPKQIADELPGGYIDADEDRLKAIARELLEETGYEGKVEFVGGCLHDAYSTLERQCFVATNCKKVANQSLEAHEQIEVVLVPLTDFRKKLQTGRMTDTEVAYLGLDYLGMLK